MPLGEDEHLLAYRLHLAEDVAGQNDRVRLAQLPDEVANLDDLCGVQPYGGFIQNNKLRAAQQRLRDAHPLTVALGQAADDPGQHFLQPGAAGSGQHLLLALRTLDPLKLCHKVQILLHGHFRVERRLLRQKAEAAARRDGLALQIVAADGDGAGRRLQAAGEHIERRGLARAVRPDEAADRPALDRERQVAHRVVCRVAPREMADLDHLDSPFVSPSPSGSGWAISSNRSPFGGILKPFANDGFGW